MIEWILDILASRTWAAYRRRRSYKLRRRALARMNIRL